MAAEILTDPAESAARLVELMQACESATWAVAWATPNKVFDAALANIAKFKKLVVGTHGCLTHPTCLEKLGPHTQVAIRRGEAAIPLFHPKLYVFEHADHYTVIVGSHNLTKGAFVSNVEVSTLTEYPKDAPIVAKLLGFVDEESHASRCLIYSQAFLARYRDLHRLAHSQRRDLEKLVQDAPSASAEAQRRSAPIYMSWQQFYDSARHDKAGSLEERLKVLRYIRNLFLKSPDFAAMDLEDRQRIAGLASAKLCKEDDINWNLFGSMNVGDAFGKPYGDLVQNQHAAVAKALAHIPLQGPVTQWHWDAYWTALKAPLPEDGKGLGSAGATRLACMKRPDHFVSLNNRSISNLAVQLDVAKGGLKDMDKYWSTVIAPIMLTPWWTQERPTDATQGEVWDFRAALLDVLVKEE